ncbi:MFS-type transporter SLC18B1-like [Galendromus occidentalis]|uniref:MFS-type transporter SLC18B1-like n=1 Tax=Galendromus occidentalis TaxID=34638 RepID=A0AAJ6QM51_9ACAR|nr:MFS-type transporter SLC18B1-like [Galendromus occidentalis]
MATLRRSSLIPAKKQLEEKSEDSIDVYDDGKSLSRDKLAAAFVCMLGCMIQCASLTVLQPFFPGVAQSRGNDVTEIGIVFSVYPFIGFISSPIIGKILSKDGSTKNMLIQGLLLDGIFICLMIPTTFLKSPAIFFLSTTAIRAVEALGYSMSLTCYYTLISTEFPDDICILIPLVETLFGLGVMLGPAIGELLYKIGGYYLPLMTLGIVTIFFAGVSYMLLPKWATKITICADKDEARSGMGTILRDPRALWSLLIVAAACTANGFNVTTLALYVKPFGLSTVMASVVYTTYGVFYAIFSFISGFLCKIIRDCRVMVISGALCHVVGMCLLGPLPFIPIKTSVRLIILGQALIGIGHGGIFNCAYIHFLRHSVDNLGFPDNDRTYALVAGLVSTAFFFGSFAGPIFGGVAMDTMGYKVGTLVMAGTVLSVTVPLTIYYVFDVLKPEILKPVGIRGMSFDLGQARRVSQA